MQSNGVHITHELFENIIEIIWNIIENHGWQMKIYQEDGEKDRKSMWKFRRMFRLTELKKNSEGGQTFSKINHQSELRTILN